MKAKGLKDVFVFSVICLLSIHVLFRATIALGSNSGVIGGGGGDGLEMRVNEIRSDILNWIEEGGAKKLALPASLSYEKYSDRMKKILKFQNVIISFTDEKVLVADVEKTCKGIAEISNTMKAHILCNISRFNETLPSGQYQLIHHEYAGLENLEKNLGASSDYQISSQLVNFLIETTVLKLSIKNSYDNWQKKYYPAAKIISDVSVCGISFKPVRANVLSRLAVVSYTKEKGFKPCGGSLEMQTVEVLETSLIRDLAGDSEDYPSDFSSLSLDIAKGNYENSRVDLILSKHFGYENIFNEGESLGLVNIKIRP